MVAKELITDDIHSLSAGDLLVEAHAALSGSCFTFLPVVDHSQYLGLISPGMVQSSPSGSVVSSASPDGYFDISVLENQHIFEVIDVFSRYELTVLPVVTAGREYLGSISLQKLISAFNQLTGATLPGAILVLSLPAIEYSPTMLARIVEENGAKIQSLYAVTDEDGQHMSVTLKLNTVETTSIMRSFDRYGILVQSHYQANTRLDDFYRTRYEEFMKYMDF
jgi:CBS domain-containing protein